MKHLLLILVTLSAATSVFAEEDREYELFILNQTDAQSFSLPLAVTHNASFSLFREKELASKPIVELAEQGHYLPLERFVRESLANASVTRGTAPVRPGKTMLIRLYPDPGQTHVTLLAKLLTTNDAFLGLGGEALPESGSREIIVPVFSSGTQIQNEQCAFIPGTPCNNSDKSNPLSPPSTIYSLPGLRGVGDLDAKLYGWSRGAALVRITRIR